MLSNEHPLKKALSFYNCVSRAIIYAFNMLVFYLFTIQKNISLSLDNTLREQTSTSSFKAINLNEIYVELMVDCLLKFQKMLTQSFCHFEF